MREEKYEWGQEPRSVRYSRVLQISSMSDGYLRRVSGGVWSRSSRSLLEDAAKRGPSPDSVAGHRFEGVLFASRASIPRAIHEPSSTTISAMRTGPASKRR